MARGWESKSVEEQMQAAEDRRERQGVQLSQEQIEMERKRDGLLLQRTRVLRDLEKCQTPPSGNDRYRETLREGLAYLESQLMALGWEG